MGTLAAAQPIPHRDHLTSRRPFRITAHILEHCAAEPFFDNRLILWLDGEKFDFHAFRGCISGHVADRGEV